MEELKYINNYTVGECYHQCHYFRINGNCMECGHPFFDTKPSYDACIITQENSRGQIPEKCPLRLGITTVIITTKLA